ncbi:MAG: HEAT repeat domain-containing protein [Acidobacteria bacterium]|nr:HEAT repeat domain-containing protein [Acidobacteriota bacterium]
MSENRLRLLQTSARSFFLAALLPASLCAIAFGQEADRRADPSEEQILSHLASGDEEQRLDAATRAGALFGTAPDSVKSSIISALGNSLQIDSSPVVRALAARAMEVSRDDRVIPPLIAALGKEREVAVRKAIIYALARYPQAQVTSALTPFLKDRKHELRAAAAYALAEIGDASSAPALIEVLQRRGKDEDAFARSQAARGLGRSGGRAAVDSLLEALARDKSQEVRREAARALGQVATKQEPKVIVALRAATTSNDPYLAVAAAEAMANINLRSQ